MEIAFYDVVLEKLSTESPQLFEILIKTNSGSTQGGNLGSISGANAAFHYMKDIFKTNSVQLPMVNIIPTPNSTQIKILNLKKITMM